ncbi:MAG: DUF3368 domain-containing protein [Bacteroidota bacterium]
MSRIIVSDTSCLVLLDKLNSLYILEKLFSEITITPEIEKEFGQSLPAWITVVEVQNKEYQTVLQTNIDAGEASAIALALEQKNCLLILDDNKARKTATRLGIDYVGTLGLLVEAKEAGFIQLVKPVLEQIKATNFRITENLERKILDLAGE